MARLDTAADAASQPDDLFLNLAEQVKLPLVQIAHAAELLGPNGSATQVEQARSTIAITSQAALKLIDGYVLSLELQRQGQLDLEPVSVSSVLYDAAEQLHAYADAHNCRLELAIGGKYGPVMAHRLVIETALVALGYSFIEATAGAKQAVVRLGVKRQGKGVAAGVFSSTNELTGNVLDVARKLRGKVHQPFMQFDSGNGSGIFIADSLFMQLQTPMQPMRLKGMQGLAAVFHPSNQLSLV